MPYEKEVEARQAYLRENQSILDQVDTELEASTNDSFFKQYILDPERLVSQILSETEGDHKVDTDRLKVVLEHYADASQEYYQRKPIDRAQIVRNQRDLPNVYTGFFGMTTFTDAINQANKEGGSDNRRMALTGCMGFYMNSVKQHYQDSLGKYVRRGVVRGKIHPRLVVTYNFLTAAWATRSHYAGLLAQRVINEDYPDGIDNDLSAFLPKYAEKVETAASSIVRRMAGLKYPVQGTPEEASIVRLINTLPVLNITELRGVAKNRSLDPLIEEEGNLLVTGLYRHYMVADSIVGSRHEISQRGVDTTLPISLSRVAQIASAHNLLQTHYRNVDVRSLHEYLYDTVPLDFEGTFPDDVIAALDNLRKSPGDAIREKIVCDRLAAHMRQTLGNRYAELTGEKTPAVNTSQGERAANFAKGLISAMFPEHILDDGGERSRVTEEVRTLRATIRKYGWETLSIPGEVYHVDDNTHLVERGLESLSLQFAPYFDGNLRGGYVATLRIRGTEEPIYLHINDLSDFRLLIPRGANYQAVDLPTSHANRDYVTRYLLQHLEPIKRGSIPTYPEPTSGPEGVKNRPEVERRERKRPYHIQARKPGENRAFFRQNTTPYSSFIKKIGAEEKINPDDLWDMSLQLLERLSVDHPDVWDRHTIREDDEITQIDSLIIRLVIARELSYEQVMDFERFAQERYRTSHPHDTDCIIRAQIHIYDLEKLSQRDPNRVRMRASFEG